MADIPTSSFPSSSSSSSMRRGRRETSELKRKCFAFANSICFGFRYVKASVLGQTKKMTAKNEEEATEADLMTAKMQVEAADAAESSNKRYR